MVRGLRDGEGVELEDEIGVAGGDHLVVDQLFAGAEVACQAGAGAHGQIPVVDHAVVDAFVVRIGLSVRAQPLDGGTVAGLAGHAVGERLFGRAHYVAHGAALVAGGVGDAEDLGHALAARLEQLLVGERVFIGDGPGGVLVAEDAALLLGERRGGAVAIGRGASARADVRLGMGGGQEDEYRNVSQNLHRFTTSTTTRAIARTAAT